MAGFENALHLRVGFWQSHTHRTRTVGGQSIALVRHGVFCGVEQGVGWQDFEQGLHHLRLSLCAHEVGLLVCGKWGVHANHFNAKPENGG